MSVLNTGTQHSEREEVEYPVDLTVAYKLIDKLENDHMQEISTIMVCHK